MARLFPRHAVDRFLEHIVFYTIGQCTIQEGWKGFRTAFYLLSYIPRFEFRLSMAVDSRGCTPAEGWGMEVVVILRELLESLHHPRAARGQRHPWSAWAVVT